MAVLDEMKNLENQKKEFMAQLGEVYYKNCKADGADVPGEAAGIIAKIDETDRQMKLLIEPETVRAGEQEPPVEEAEEVQSEYQGSVCPKCGAPVEPDQIFCVNCGTKLEEEAAEQAEEKAEEAAEEESDSEPIEEPVAEPVGTSSEEPVEEAAEESAEPEPEYLQETLPLGIEISEPEEEAERKVEIRSVFPEEEAAEPAFLSPEAEAGQDTEAIFTSDNGGKADVSPDTGLLNETEKELSEAEQERIRKRRRRRRMARKPHERNAMEGQIEMWDILRANGTLDGITDDELEAITKKLEESVRS